MRRLESFSSSAPGHNPDILEYADVFFFSSFLDLCRTFVSLPFLVMSVILMVSSAILMLHLQANQKLHPVS